MKCYYCKNEMGDVEIKKDGHIFCSGECVFRVEFSKRWQKEYGKDKMKGDCSSAFVEKEIDSLLDTIYKTADYQCGSDEQRFKSIKKYISEILFLKKNGIHRCVMCNAILFVEGVCVCREVDYTGTSCENRLKTRIEKEIRQELGIEEQERE